MRSQFRLVFFGPPGSGKGTIAGMVNEKWQLPYLATGEYLRQQIRAGTKLGELAEPYVKEGKLVPDAPVIQFVREKFEKGEFDNGFIFDGFPRTVPQVEALNKILTSRRENIDLVIYLNVTDEEAVKRLSGRRQCVDCGAIYNIDSIPTKVPGVCDNCGGKVIQRDDDTPETIQKRLNIYKRQTADVQQFFQDVGLLYTVNAMRGREYCVSVIADLLDNSEKLMATRSVLSLNADNSLHNLLVHFLKLEPLADEYAARLQAEVAYLIAHEYLQQGKNELTQRFAEKAIDLYISLDTDSLEGVAPILYVYLPDYMHEGVVQQRILDKLPQV